MLGPIAKYTASLGVAAWTMVVAPSCAPSRAAPGGGSVARPGDAGPAARSVDATARGIPGPVAQLPVTLHLGSLGFEIRDADTGGLITGKLTVLGARGTAGPQWTRTDLPREGPGLIMAYDRVFSITGTGAVPLPPGTYDVYVSRGLEWDLHVARDVQILKGQQTDVRARLRHVVATPGWASVDFHVHAAMSSDSRVPMIARVHEFVAEGIDMIVSTDHNVVSDYAPYIEELGVGDLLASTRGDEITTATWGHFGAFPLPRELAEAGHGAVPAGGSARELFARVRSRAPGAVIDVHHPRLDETIGYFNLGALDSKSDRAARAGFSFDFDALEVLNGYQDPDRKSVDRTIDDWLALLDHGHLVTATGNSDTHHLTYNLAGYPRNYVRVPDDRVSKLTPEGVAAALKAHRSYFTTGPIVRVTVGAAEMGDLAPVKGDRIIVDVEVRAAPWVTVSGVVLHVGGRDVLRRAVPRSTEAVRFHDGFEVTVDRDQYVVVRVDGDRPLTPVIGDGSRFVVYPLAITNPIFLDRDGDGVYDPPSPHGPHGP